MSNKLNLSTGEKIGKLTIIESCYHDNKFMWKCQCDCGNIDFKSSTYLSSSKRARPKGCKHCSQLGASKKIRLLRFKRCAFCRKFFSLKNRKRSAKTCGYSCGSKLKYKLDPRHREITRQMGIKQIQVIISEGKHIHESNHKFYKRGYLLNLTTNEETYFASGFEKGIMEEFNKDDSILTWTNQHRIKIPYFYKNKTYMYLPDFLIIYKDGVKKLVETKGRIYDPEQLKLKIKVGFEYCLNNNMIYQVIFQDKRKKQQFLNND